MAQTASAMELFLDTDESRNATFVGSVISAAPKATTYLVRGLADPNCTVERTPPASHTKVYCPASDIGAPRHHWRQALQDPLGVGRRVLDDADERSELSGVPAYPTHSHSQLSLVMAVTPSVRSRAGANASGSS
ncbi:hypothetical protein INS49_005511 [Diaporthe citri]|uniref:uncharacterized protein n=1 Tax=Diaporthe citri TaxID=83186 RepID=UPI001C80744C|nr:uncharacterized protein INS49_005511 [Diaporthe citri]KAG6353549.1 hypothetical protein INS49_005511 [Diaporthe citri]